MTHHASTNLLMTSSNVHSKELAQRLIRLETKLVRGFEELGVNIDAETDWISVDEMAGEIHLHTLGRSMKVLLTTMHKLGASRYGQEYVIYVNKVYFGTILLNDPNSPQSALQKTQ